MEEFSHKDKPKISKVKVGLFVGGIVIGLLVGLFVNNITGFSGFAGLDAYSVGEDTVNFINSYLMGGQEAVLRSASFENGLYKITLSVSGQEFTSYVSKDKTLLFPQAIDMTGVAQPSTKEEPSPDVPKLDEPKVELFVMSHCPYGAQAEKGLIPVVELLGDKIDFSVKFVYYAMHGEKEVNEEMRQVCIQKEQKEKFLDYLKCFLEAGESEKCLSEAEIDKTKLSSCITALDKEYNITNMLNDKTTWLDGRFPLFPVYQSENMEYGVRGSPTLVINGQQVSPSDRSSAAFLKVICAGFNEPPSECDTQVSAASPSPGFGWGNSGGSSGGSCG